MGRDGHGRGSGDGPDPTILLDQDERQAAIARAKGEASLGPGRPPPPLATPNLAAAETRPRTAGVPDETEVLSRDDLKAEAGPTVKFNPDKISSVQEPWRAPTQHEAAPQTSEAGFDDSIPMPAAAGEGYEPAPTEMYERGNEYGSVGGITDDGFGIDQTDPSVTDPDKNQTASASADAGHPSNASGGYRPGWLAQARPVDLPRPAEGATAAFTDLSDEGAPVPLPPELSGQNLAEPLDDLDPGPPATTPTNLQVEGPPRRRGMLAGVLVSVLLLGFGSASALMIAGILPAPGPIADLLNDIGLGEEGAPPPTTAAPDGEDGAASATDPDGKPAPGDDTSGPRADAPLPVDGPSGPSEAPGPPTVGEPTTPAAARAALAAVEGTIPFRIVLAQDTSGADLDGLAGAMRAGLISHAAEVGPLAATRGKRQSVDVSLWVKAIDITLADTGTKVTCACSMSVVLLPKGSESSLHQANSEINVPDLAKSDEEKAAFAALAVDQCAENLAEALATEVAPHAPALVVKGFTPAAEASAAGKNGKRSTKLKKRAKKKKKKKKKRRRRSRKKR